MRKQIVAGNWKMNGSLELIQDFLPNLASISGQLSKAEILLFPPSLYLSTIKSFNGLESVVGLGAQNIAAYPQGAYTGEISAQMLADLTVEYVLVGHSERRTLFGETNEVVADKVGMAIKHGVVPILCVGETLEEREAGKAQEIVVAQINAVLDRFDEEQLSKLIVAYEPVWAIGTGRTASPEVAQEMHAIIRQCLAAKSEEFSQRTSLLYGGSVNAENAESLFSQVDIDGGLVGGASLRIEEFIKICRCLG